MYWKDLVKYPNLIPHMDSSVKDLLDTMSELIPIEWERDRLGTFLHWREACKEAGLITTKELHQINHEMIHGCGGL